MYFVTVEAEALQLIQPGAPRLIPIIKGVQAEQPKV